MQDWIRLALLRVCKNERVLEKRQDLSRLLNLKLHEKTVITEDHSM